MKKSLFIIFLAWSAVFLFSASFMQNQAHAGICGATPCVDSNDIINGQVTG